jgi:uridine kinase
LEVNVEKKALVIGIAGGSASGKSTICGYIHKELEGLKVETLHIDAYYKENMPKIIAPITGIEYEDFCLLYTSPSPRDRQKSRMPSSA